MKPRFPESFYSHVAQRGFILRGLNTDANSSRHAEMRRLVDCWNRTGRRASELLQRQPELAARLGDDYSGKNCKIVPWKTAAIATGSGLELFIGTAISRRWRDADENRDLQIEEAQLLFIALLLHPERDKLSEQPCARCGCYYFKKTARQKVYCSRNCAKDGTAAYATKKRLAEQHQKKIRVAKQEARNWSTARTKQDWKHWVCSRPKALDAELSPKFLTRAVNRGEIQSPIKGGN